MLLRTCVALCFLLCFRRYLPAYFCYTISTRDLSQNTTVTTPILLLPNETIANDFSTSTTTTTTTTQATVITTEQMLNMSSAYDSFWVKTVIEVSDVDFNVNSPVFVSTMEYKLATVYSLAMEKLQGGAATAPGQRRRRRAITYLNATIQMTNTTRDPGRFVNTQLIYFLVEFNDTENLTSAADTCSLMKLVPTQQVAIMLGYVVVVHCEPYLPPPPNYLWVIGAVIGGVIGLVIFIWLILYTYYSCTRGPRYYAKNIQKTQPVTEADGKTSQVESQQSVAAAAETNQQQQLSDSQTTQHDHIEDVNGEKASTSLTAQKQQKRVTRKKRKKKVKRVPRKVLVDQQKSSESAAEKNDEETSSADDDRDVGLQSTVGESESVKQTRPVPMHTPLHIARTGGRSVIEPWSPYLAADLANFILTQSPQQQPLSLPTMTSMQSIEAAWSQHTQVSDQRHDTDTLPAAQSFTGNTISRLSTKNDTIDSEQGSKVLHLENVNTQQQAYVNNGDSSPRTAGTGTSLVGVATLHDLPSFSLADSQPKVAMRDLIREEFELLFAPPLGKTTNY